MAFRRDATERIDCLTGLASRGRLERCLERRCRRPLHGDSAGGDTVVLLDIVGLKGLNQSDGFLSGDALIRLVARRMERLARGVALLGRLGGDEFLAVFRPSHSLLADRFAANVSRPSDRPQLRVAVTRIMPGDAPHKIIARLDATLRELRCRVRAVACPDECRVESAGEMQSSLDGRRPQAE